MLGTPKQHLDNLRRKDSLSGAATVEISVRLGNYSASHFAGSAPTPREIVPLLPRFRIVAVSMQRLQIGRARIASITTDVVDLDPVVM